VISPVVRPLPTQGNTNTGDTRTDIHTLSVSRTHDPSVRARDHYDRQEEYVINRLLRNQACGYLVWKGASKEPTHSVLRLKMEAAVSSETPAHTYETKRRPFPDTVNLMFIAVGASDHAYLSLVPFSLVYLFVCII
jgi:hypothetical protein